MCLQFGKVSRQKENRVKMCGRKSGAWISNQQSINIKNEHRRYCRCSTTRTCWKSPEDYFPEWNLKWSWQPSKCLRRRYQPTNFQILSTSLNWAVHKSEEWALMIRESDKQLIVISWPVLRLLECCWVNKVAGEGGEETISLVSLQCLLVQNRVSLHMNPCFHSPDFNPPLYLKMRLQLLSVFLVRSRSYCRNLFTILTKHMHIWYCISIRDPISTGGFAQSTELYLRNIFLMMNYLVTARLWRKFPMYWMQNIWYSENFKMTLNYYK